MGHRIWMSRCRDNGEVDTVLWDDSDLVPPGWYDSPGEAREAWERGRSPHPDDVIVEADKRRGGWPKGKARK